MKKSGIKNNLRGSKRKIYISPCPSLHLHIQSAIFSSLKRAARDMNCSLHSAISWHQGEEHSPQKSQGHSVCNISICCSLRNHVIILEGIMFTNTSQCPNTKYQPQLGFLCSHFSDGCAMIQQSSPGVESRQGSSRPYKPWRYHEKRVRKNPSCPSSRTITLCSSTANSLMKGT